MGKKLAIKGHPTRGKEVIELLEMMGGKNIEGYIGIDYNEFYTIEDGYIIQSYDWNDCLIFTLEKFLEKYSYKVGDKVHIYVQNDDTDGRYDIEVTEITSMRWIPARCKIAYKMKDINREFYKEEIKCKVDDNTKPSKMKNVLAELLEHIKTTPKEELEREFEEIAEWSNVGPTVEEFRTFCECVNKKPVYPDNYEECVRIAKNIHGYDIHIDAPAYRELLESFVKLLICRDAYWKIYGEYMGLGKPWEPDWMDETTKYGIRTYQNTVIKDNVIRTNCAFVFPTLEIQDAFYENFKDLIKQCMELL